MQTQRPATRSPFPLLYHLLFSSTSQTASSPPPPSPERYALPSLLKTSATNRNVRHGGAAHAAAFKRALASDPFIASSIISMYSKCDALSDAAYVFDELPHRDAPTWNSMIDGYFRHGRATTAFSCFIQMQSSGVSPDGHSLSIVFSGAGESFQLELGKQAHAYLLKNIFNPDEFISTSLINMYLKCGRSSGAIAVFRSLSRETSFPSVWNAMIGGLWQMGLWERSFEFYAEMKRRGVFGAPSTYSSLLAACSHGGKLDLAEIIHGDVIKSGLEEELYVCTSLVSVYGKFGAMESAEKVFAGAAKKMTVLCNAMISACAVNGRAREAILVYGSMNGGRSRRDSLTIVNALAACSSSTELQELGRMIHGQSVKIPEGLSVSVSTSLMTMYWRWGRVEESSVIFELVEEKDAALWGSMVAGLCQNKKLQSAMSLVNRMLFSGLKPDSAILASVASAAARSEQEELGFQIHGHSVKVGLDADTFVGSALVDVYAKSGLLESACKVFAGVEEKNLVAWNSIISGYGRSGDVARCIAAFGQMRIAGIPPDSISITGALVAASTSAALFSGKMIHAFQIRNHIQNDYQVGNSLIEMYARCGCLSDARQIFDDMQEKSIATWNSMIAGYGSHGLCDKAVNLFQEMKNTTPDGITFLALISACNHRGFTELGINFFNQMVRNHKIEPTPQHYAAAVDLLGRAGRLQEAFHLAGDIQIAGDDTVWLSLICASRFHRNVEAAEAAASRVPRLKVEDHVQMWKLYGEAGMAEKAAEERRRMKMHGLKKTPGCSWIELGGRVKVFFSGSSSSPLGTELHGLLWSFKWALEEEDVIL